MGSPRSSAPAFASAEELFAAVRALIAELREKDRSDRAGGAGTGKGTAAAELAKGFGCLNGLTDGWAAFLESVERVEAEHARRLAPEQRATLSAIRRAVRSVVRRR